MQKVVRYLSVVAASCSLLSSCVATKGTTQQDPFALTNYTLTGHSPQPCVSFFIDAPAQTNQGTEVNVTLTAQNTCEEEIRLPLGYNIHHDLLVLDGANAVLWQFGAVGGPRLAIIEYEVLSPDEVLTFEVTWPGTTNKGGVVPAGDYRLVGLLYSSDESNPEVYTPENQNFEAVQSLSIKP